MKYRFKFSGELAKKATVKRAKTNLARAFNVSEAELDGLFNGEQEFVREDLDKTAADSYASLFKRAGALTTVSKMSDQGDHPVSTSKLGHPETLGSLESLESSDSAKNSESRNVNQVSPSTSDADLDNPYAPQPSLASRNRKSKEQKPRAVKQSNSSEPWLRYGGLAVVAMLIADAQLQDALIVDRYGLDLGYWPLILAHIPLFIGCYLLAKEKRLAAPLRLLGLFSFAGLSVLLLLPDKRTKGIKVSLKALAVTVLSFGIFIYWTGSAVRTSATVEKYTAKFAELSVGRQEFPSEATQSEERVYLDEQAEMRAIMQEIIELANADELRPNQASQLGDQMMHSLAAYSAWRQHQTYLHRIEGIKLPTGLSEDFEQQDERLFSGLLSSITPASNARLYEAVNVWLVAPIDEAEFAKSRRIRSQMNMIFDSVRNAQIVQFAPLRGRSQGWKPPSRLDLSKVEFPQIDGAILARFRNHIEYKFDTPDFANKTLAIGFYMVPGKKTWSRKNPPPQVVFRTLNNDLPAKHTSTLISVLKRYQ